MGEKLRAIRSRVPRSDVIESVGNLDRHAKSGDLQGLVWVALWSDGSVSSGWRQLSRRLARSVVGELEFAKRDIIRRSEDE